MQDKETFISHLYWMNREEREAIGQKIYDSVELYYKTNKPFIDAQWEHYEKTGKHPFLEKNNL